MLLKLSEHARSRYRERSGHEKYTLKKIRKMMQCSIEVELKPHYKVKELERLREIAEFREKNSRYFYSRGFVLVVCNEVIVTVYKSDFSKFQEKGTKGMLPAYQQSASI